MKTLVVRNVKLRPNESMKSDWTFPLINETESEIIERLKAEGRFSKYTATHVVTKKEKGI